MKRDGIEKFDEYFDDHPEEVVKCAHLVKVKDVNSAAVFMHNAKNKQDLLGNLDKTFTDDSFNIFKEEMIALAHEKTRFHAEGKVKTLQGESRHILLNLFMQHEKNNLALVSTIDITERKRAQDELVRERNLLRTLIDHIPDSVYVKNRKSEFLVVNQELARRVQIKSPEALVGKTDFDIHPRQLAEEYFKVDQEIFRTGKPVINKEVNVLDQETGEMLINLTTKVPFRNTEGELVGLVGIGRNITEQKRTEEKLKKRMAELTAVQKLGIDITSGLILDQFVEAVMRGVKNAIGPDCILLYSRDEDELILLGWHIKTEKFDLEKAKVHHVGECLCGLAVHENKSLFSKNINQDARCTLLECKEAGFTSLAAVPLFSQDRIIGVLAMASEQERDFQQEADFIDILCNEIGIGLQNALYLKQIKDHTVELENEIELRKKSERALRESEQKFRSLTEKSLTGVYIIQDQLLKYVNPKFAEIFEYTVTEIANNMGPKDLVYHSDWPLVQSNIRKRLQGEVQSLHYDFRGAPNTGRSFLLKFMGPGQSIREGRQF